MNDLIYKQDAINAIDNESRVTDNKRDLSGLYLAKSIIETLPSADRPTGWIPVSERLPRDNKEVLISCEWGVDIGEHDCDGWRSEWINHYDDDNVLAWMPLPPPWKE